MVTLPWTGIWFLKEVDILLVTSNATVYNGMTRLCLIGYMLLA